MIGLLLACAEPKTCPDSDLDRLDDCAEEALGTDPAVADTDGDGYADGDEVTEGTDPLSDRSVIYIGGWPYNPDKDQLGEPSFDGTASVGAQVPRFVGVDQHGEEVDLYDLAGHGVPLVIDVSAGWCVPCRELAAWLDGTPSTTFDADPSWATVRQAVDDGEVSWVTVLFEDEGSAPADPAFAAQWAEVYPNPEVLVLADGERRFTDWWFPGAYPNLHLVSDAMIVEIYDPFGFEAALDELAR